MAQMEKSYQEEMGYLKPKLLRLGSNGGCDDESGPVMFTDACPCCGSKKRRCLTPSFEPRKKTILIDPSSLIHDGGSVAPPPVPARTAPSPPPTVNPFASFVFPNHQKSPPLPPPLPPSSSPPFFIGSASNSTSPPSTSLTKSNHISISSKPISISSNPIPISSNSVSVSCSSPEQRFSATPPRPQPNPYYVRSYSSPITYPTPPSPVISPNQLRRSVSDPNTSFVPATETNSHHDQMTILPANSVPTTTLVRSPSIAYCRPSLSNSSVTPQAAMAISKTVNGGETSSTTSSQNRDNPKVLGRLSCIKDSLAEMNKLLSEIIQEHKDSEDEEEAEETEQAEQDEEETERYEEEETEQYEEDENIDNSCKEIYEYETLPEENVISTERSGDAMRVRYMCCCGKRYQIVLGAIGY